MTLPKPLVVHKICWLVDVRKWISSQIRGLELPLRNDARRRFRKKQSLHRVAYRVVKQGRREVVEFFELRKHEKIPPTNHQTMALLVFKAGRRPPRMREGWVAVIREQSHSSKPIPSDLLEMK